MHRILLTILLTTSLFAKDIIAVIELEQKGLTKQEAEILTDRLITKLISIDKFQVVERTNMDKILKEQKFQHSGCTDSECAVEIGQLLNTDFIVIGSVSKFGSTYSIDARLIDVGTGKSLTSADYSMKGEIDELLITGITSITKQLCKLEDNPQDTPTPTPPSPTPPQVTQAIYEYCVGNDICLTINNHIKSDKVFDVIMANNVEVAGFTFNITGINILSVNGGLLYNNEYEIKYPSIDSLELTWDDKGTGYYSAKGFQAYSLKGKLIQPTNGILATIKYSGIAKKICIDASIVGKDAKILNTKNPECIYP